MPDMTPQEAATELRHIADIYVTPAAKQACLMGAEALENVAKEMARVERLRNIYTDWAMEGSNPNE